jgi:hypothetical protein
VATLNDEKKRSLLSLLGGTQGSVDDLFKEWLVANVTGANAKNTIPDLWKLYLSDQGYSDGTLQDDTKAYLAAKGYTGSLADMEKAAWAADDYLGIAYLLRATFTGGDQAIADTETIGPTGDGATYEGYTESGTGTAVETSTGSVSISSNQLALTGDGSSLTTTGMIWSGVARTVGRAFKVAFVPAAATDIGAVTLHSTASLATGNLVLKVGWGSDGTFTVSSYSPAGTLAKAYNTGTYTSAGGTIEIVLGGWDSDTQPDATADYGASVFFDNGTTRVLLATVPELNTATVYLGMAQQTATEVLFDVLTVPDVLTAEAVFTPTGYAMDLFTDTNGVLVSDHALSSGGSWTVAQFAGATAVDNMEIQSNQAAMPVPGNSTLVGEIATVDTGETDVFVVISATQVANGGHVGGTRPVSRYVDADNLWVGLQASFVSDTFGIQERTAATTTTRDTVSYADQNGVEVSIAYRVTGDDHECWAPNRNKAEYTSTSHNTATKHGISLIVSTGTTGTINSPKINSFLCLPITSADYDTALDAF